MKGATRPPQPCISPNWNTSIPLTPAYLMVIPQDKGFGLVFDEAPVDLREVLERSDIKPCRGRQKSRKQNTAIGGHTQVCTGGF